MFQVSSRAMINVADKYIRMYKYRYEYVLSSEYVILNSEFSHCDYDNVPQNDNENEN
jgi:hypothetical protein